jgi:hypothetical protein
LLPAIVGPPSGPTRGVWKPGGTTGCAVLTSYQRGLERGISRAAPEPTTRRSCRGGPCVWRGGSFRSGIAPFLNSGSSTAGAGRAAVEIGSASWGRKKIRAGSFSWWSRAAIAPLPKEGIIRKCHPFFGAFCHHAYNHMNRRSGCLARLRGRHALFSGGRRNVRRQLVISKYNITIVSVARHPPSRSIPSLRGLPVPCMAVNARSRRRRADPPLQATRIDSFAPKQVPATGVHEAVRAETRSIE